jgi:hypothetical protein
MLTHFFNMDSLGKLVRLFGTFSQVAHLQLGLYTLEPPTRVCIDPKCSQSLLADPSTLRERELVEPSTFPVTIFTKEFGSIPSFATSRYCRREFKSSQYSLSLNRDSSDCHTRYHPNYFVHSEATLRTFYPGVPMFVQSSQHFYIDKDICELFSVMMATSWYVQFFMVEESFLTCFEGPRQQTVLVHITPGFLTTQFDHPCLRPGQQAWNLMSKMCTMHFLSMPYFSTIRLATEHWNCPIPRSLSLSVCVLLFMSAIRVWLASGNLPGTMPAIFVAPLKLTIMETSVRLHCFDFNSIDILNLDAIRSTVTDGITIGRPCCSVHDCMEPLPTVKHRYCVRHRQLDQQCAVTTCDHNSDPGFRTCSNPDHRRLESYYYLQGKAMFQLKHRLEQINVSQTHDSMATSTTPSRIRMTNELDGDLMPDLVDAPEDDTDDGVGEGPGADADEDVEIDAAGICDGKPDKGNKTVRARFGRRRTHNEQLCVGSCGVILGRATFYGSEAPNGVRVRSQSH